MLLHYHFLPKSKEVSHLRWFQEILRFLQKKATNLRLLMMDRPKLWLEFYRDKDKWQLIIKFLVSLYLKASLQPLKEMLKLRQRSALMQTEFFMLVQSIRAQAYRNQLQFRILGESAMRKSTEWSKKLKNSRKKMQKGKNYSLQESASKIRLIKARHSWITLGINSQLKLFRG